MALIKCPECGQQVSDKAKKCPHCGYDLTIVNENNIKPHKKTPWLWITCGVVLAGVLVSVWLFINRPSNSEIEPKVSESILSEKTNEMVEITPEFSEKISRFIQMSEFSEGRAAVMTDEYKWGFINTKGDLVIPALYKGWPNPPKFSDGLAFVETEHDKSYIDINGKGIIKLSTDDVGSDFVNGKAVVYSAHQNEDWTFTISKTFRVINKQGETLNEIPIPSGIELIGEGIGGDFPMPVKISSEGFLVLDAHTYRLRLYDFQGNYLEEKEDSSLYADPTQYDYIVFEENQGVADNVKTLRGIKDKHGNIIVPAKEWRFPNSIYNIENRCSYINPHQGLFLAILEESPYYLKDIDEKRVMEESIDASYFGFVNLNGEDTFSPERWERQKIQSYNVQNQITTY